VQERVAMFLIILGVLFLIIMWIISIYNNIVHSKSMVNEAWSGIDVQLKRRHDLIPNLVETVKGYSIHEKGVIEEIVRARAASMGAVPLEQKEKVEYALTNSLKSLFALAEQYPNLKANENFLALQSELSAIEGELQLARRYYNGSVRHYMILLMQFPSNIIARLFNFAPVSYFELANSEERNNPSVKF
jgi:LemA protein